MMEEQQPTEKGDKRTASKKLAIITPQIKKFCKEIADYLKD